MKRSKKKTNDVQKVNEPLAEYSTNGRKSIVFFNSFEEAKEQSRIEMAAASYEDRLTNLKILRQKSKRLSPTTKNKQHIKTITVLNAHYL